MDGWMDLTVSDDILTGKPRPRWAEKGFRNSSRSHQWHYRAADIPKTGRRSSVKSDSASGTSTERGFSRGSHSTDLSSELDAAPYHLPAYLPSEPDATMRYHELPLNTTASTSSTFSEDRRSSGTSSSGQSPNLGYPTTPWNYQQYTSVLPGTASLRTATHRQYSPSDPRAPAICQCRSSPGTGHAIVTLGMQLQQAVDTLHRYQHHCDVYQRMSEMADFLQYVRFEI